MTFQWLFHNHVYFPDSPVSVGACFSYVPKQCKNELYIHTISMCLILHISIIISNILKKVCIYASHIVADCCFSHFWYIYKLFSEIYNMSTQILHSEAYIPLQCKTISVGYWRWLGPQTPHFCVTYTNMLVSFALGDANFSRYLTQNPQRESVEYRLHRVPNANFLRWPCTFHFFVCRFHWRWVANTNPISSGIWA